MQRELRKRFVVAADGAILHALVFLLASCSPRTVDQYSEVAREPDLSPDYSGTVVPANIAPLNLQVREEGRAYFLRVHSQRGTPITAFSRTGQMRIFARPWRRLLEANRGRDLHFDIYVQGQDRQWRRFLPVTNTIAKEDIDGTLVFRLMKPLYNWWKDISIYQRDLAGFHTSLVRHGRSFGEGCLNCHSFAGNDPDTLSISLRSATYGSHTLLAQDGQVDKVGAKWGYTAWHLSGRLAYDMFTFSLNPHALLLTHEQRESDLALQRLSDVFLELGHANMAQKLASELLATKDHLGVALETLGRVSLVKGQPETARIYLNARKRDPIRRPVAESWLHDLDRGLPPDRAAYIERIRSYMPDDPLAVAAAEPLDQTLARLLAVNPLNKMAFEYLVACYLLTGKVDKITENLHRLDELGYRATPTLYEEAVLIHYASQRQKPDLGSFKISPETIRRYQRFVQLRSGMTPQNQQATFNLLIREFGTSYFFYFAFGSVGLV